MKNNDKVTIVKEKPQDNVKKVSFTKPPKGNAIAKRKGLSLNTKRSIAGLLFVLPFIIGLIFNFLPALIQAGIFSFHKINVTDSGYTLNPVGFHYYFNAFNVHPYFKMVLIESLGQIFLSVPLILTFSFFTASILNQKFKGRAFFRAVLFLPVIIGAGVIIKIENWSAISFQADSVVQSSGISALDLVPVLHRLGVPVQIINHLSTIISQIYQVITDSGVQILIFLGAMQTIPPSLYEASTMDGATGWENFWKITFPMLTPYILSNMVYTVVDNLTNFKSSIMRVILNTATDLNGDLSYSIAMAFIFFICEAFILLVLTFLVSRLVYYYE